MSHDRQRDALIEATTTAYRERGRDGAIRPSPAFWDLDDAGRREAFDRAVALRRLEAALHPEGLNLTVQAVLDRIRGA